MRGLLEILIESEDVTVLSRGRSPSSPLMFNIPEAELTNQPRSLINPSTSTRKLSP